MAKKPKTPKLTKKEKKALYKQQLALEKQLVDEGKIPRRTRYQPRSIFWRVFAVCLSFIFGIITALGGLVGGVLYMGLHSSADDVLGMFGIETSNILNEAYANMSVLDLYRTLVDDLNSQPITSLSVLTKYTPLIDKYLALADDILLPFGISPDWDTIKKTDFKDLGTYMQTVLLPSVEIGPILRLDGEDVTLESINSNSALYALAYGKYGTDYALEEGKITMIGESRPTTVGDILPTLKDGSGTTDYMGGVMDFLKGIELGTVLGLDILLDSEEVDSQTNIFYTLCYGTEGKDYEIRDHIVYPLSDREPVTLGALLDNPSEIIMEIQVGPLLNVTAVSDSIVRYIAYGREMLKDEDGNYLKDESGNYQTERDEEGNLQYVGGGRYVIEEEKIVMLPDPNSETGELYSPKTIRELTAEDADLMGGVTIGDMTDLDDTSSGLMWQIRDWTLEDLKDQNNIMGLKIGNVITIDSNSSAIMRAMQNWTIADLGNQRRIEWLKVGNLLSGGDSKLLAAISDWRISDLSKQEKINSITLRDILDIDPNDENTPQIMLALADMTLGEISSDIDKLTLEDVLGAKAFENQDGFDGNRILTALRYMQINELGDAIQKITLQDVFGDEMFSYAKNYVEGKRPADTDKVTSGVETLYYAEGTQVFAYWYTGSDMDGWTIVPEGTKIIQERHIEKEVEVTATPTYYVITYTAKDDSDDREEYRGEVLTDADGHYYMNGEARIDLEEILTFSVNGEPIPSGQRILSREGNSGKEYYYIEKIDVTQRYAAARESGKTYAYDEVTESYRADGEEVTRYYAGIWYLLLNGTQEGAATLIADMGDLVAGVTGKFNSLSLGEMYAHEVIEQNPSKDISSITQRIEDLKEYKNLDELNVSQVIRLVVEMADMNWA